MSYNSNTKTITAAASVYDVQQALNTSENDVGRLCTHQNINMWARYKPIRVRQFSPVTTDTRRRLGYGLETIAVYDGSFNTFFTAVKNMIVSTGHNGYKWGVKYNKPTGTSESPYRLADFASPDYPLLGYCDNAELYHSPIGGNYSLSLTYRPLLDGYTESRSMETVTVSRSDTPITIPVDAQQEINAWSAFDPERSVASDTGTQKQLSVTALDIMCNSSADKVNFFNNGTMQMRRGFMITDGSSLLKWSVGEIPFASWLGMEGGLTNTWYFAEFYTNVNAGNYDSNTSQVGRYILIPAAFGQIDITVSAGTSEFIALESTGHIVPSTDSLEISFKLNSSQSDFIATYDRIRINCDCHNSTQTQGATFFNGEVVNASYFQNSLVWENYEVQNASQYDGYTFNLFVYGDRNTGGSYDLLLEYHTTIN